MRITGRLEEPTVHRLWNALTMMVCLWTLLTCGLDADDRMVRRYAKCLGEHQHHPASPERVQRNRHCNAERRGDGRTVAWSTGARGAHHGEDQGRLRPLL